MSDIQSLVTAGAGISPLLWVIWGGLAFTVGILGACVFCEAIRGSRE